MLISFILTIHVEILKKEKTFPFLACKFMLDFMSSPGSLVVLELGIIGRQPLEAAPWDSGGEEDATSKDMEETVALEEVRTVGASRKAVHS